VPFPVPVYSSNSVIYVSGHLHKHFIAACTLLAQRGAKLVYLSGERHPSLGRFLAETPQGRWPQPGAVRISTKLISQFARS